MPRRGMYVGVVTLATAATVAIVAAGLWLTDGARPPADGRTSASPSPTATSGPAALDGVAVARGPFCEAVDDEAVQRAVGSPASRSAYGSGDRVRLERGLTDVAHEFGCTVTGSRVTARAWVFAAPVRRPMARRLVREATTGCDSTGDLRFGSPGAVVACGADRRRTLRAVGLFGDAWVHCELAAPATRSDVVDTGERWCVDVTRAMASAG